MERADVARQLARHLRPGGGRRRGRRGLRGRAAGERKHEEGDEREGAHEHGFPVYEPQGAMPRDAAARQYPKPGEPRCRSSTCARSSFAVHSFWTPNSACLTSETIAALTGALRPSRSASRTTSPFR